MLIVNKYKITNIILLSLIYLWLEYVYKEFVYVDFKYMGFVYMFSLKKYILSKFVFIFFIVLISVKVNSKFIYSIYLLFFLFLFIPNLIYFEFNNSDIRIIVSICKFLIFLKLFDHVKLNIPIVKITENQSLYLIVSLALILMIPFVMKNGFNLNYNLLKLKDVYEVRESASEHSFYLSGYFYSNLAKVVLPVLLIFSIIKKRYVFIIISITALVYLYLIAGHKSVFFGTIVIVMFFFFKDYYKKICVFIFLVFLYFIGSRILSIYGNIIPESMIVRRVFFIPALLNEFYFDYFHKNHVFFSHSVLSSFVEYPYDLPPSKIIGEVYFGSENNNANNGFISDGFLNLGMTGVILFSLLISFIIKIISVLKVDSRYFGVYFLMIFTLISSAFFTSLLTHGIILLLLISYFFLKTTKFQ